MDERQQRIHEDLNGLLEGEVRCDPLTVAMYSSDSSMYQLAPLGVVYPRCAEDLTILTQYADTHRLTLTARGAGSGLAGGALGQGLIVDFSRHFNRIRRVDAETVRVEAGVVRSELNRVLREHGRYFPPDPSNTDITTVGGMLGVDAAGSHSIRVGSTRDHVQSIELVLASGDRVEAGSEPLRMLQERPPARDADELSPGVSATHEVFRTLVSKLAGLLQDNAQLIKQYQPALVHNCSGYFLRNVVTETHLNLARMLVGSEGTLGLFTAATLHTAPLPAYRGAALVLFGQLEQAVRSAQALASVQPSVCDLLDRRLLSLAVEADPRFEPLIPAAAEAALIIEQTGLGVRPVRRRVELAINAIRQVDSSAYVALEAVDPAEVDFLLSLTEQVVPNLTRLGGRTRPLPFVEDIAVPPQSLHEFVVEAQRVFQKHQITASLYAHAAAGQLHFRPFLPKPTVADGGMIESLAEDLYQAVFAVGGTISGEHGDGLSRSDFVQRQYGPLYRVFQQIKDTFDPHNILNPGKIVSASEHGVRSNLRPIGVPDQLVELQLNWSAETVIDEAERCNGCGVCRTQEPELRMCPFFRIDQIEEATPRAKANLIRAMASDQLAGETLRSAEVKRLAALCFNCKQCQLECPTNVNIPKLMIEARSSFVAANGMSRADWILSRAHSFGPLLSRFALISNAALNNRPARWLMEKLVGISRLRKLPRLARRPFLKSLPRSLREPPAVVAKTRPVVYFVDYYANYHDPELAEAFIAVLAHNNIPVHVPRNQKPSGMAMICAGDLDAARELAEQNVRTLADFARDGCQIVCTEPTAVVTICDEYPGLLDHPDVPVVAKQTIEAGAFLRQLHREGRLRTDFGPLEGQIAYHLPCHLRALENESPLLELLSLIPELSVRKIDHGCSGMAGAFGLTRENFTTSVRIGWDLISEMRSGEFTAGTTECSSCRLQMEQGTATPTVHPIKLLAIAYGLMPQLAKRLQPNRKKLVST